MSKCTNKSIHGNLGGSPSGARFDLRQNFFRQFVAVEPYKFCANNNSPLSTASGEPGAGSPVDQASTDGAANASHVTEPKGDASASDPAVASNIAPTDNIAVATVSGQVANPGPQDDASRSESQALNPAPTTETATSAASTLATPAPTKRFTSMNINKKFLAKTAGSPSSSHSPAAPKASTSTAAARPALVTPQPSSRLITKKLTAAAPVAPASGGWSLRPTPPMSLSSSPVPGEVSAATQPGKSPATAEANHPNRPALLTSASGLSADARSSARASREQSPVKAWATVPTTVEDNKRNLQDFPTAAEAAADSTEHKRPGASTVQPPHHSAVDSAAETDIDNRDSFRGIHLDPNAHHWDEMEDESNDFLGEVIDFGDGKTYAVPHEEAGSTPASTSNQGSRVEDDYDRSWPRSRSLHSEPEGPHGSRFSQHGLPPRQPDSRHLFNERSNRLEPAKAPPSTVGSAFHQHAPPYAHLPPRSAPRRNSTLSSSDRSKLGHGREPPPHTRDLPPHAQGGFPSDGKTRRPSDARSSHSPIERRSSFLHDEERPRMGSIGLKGRAPEDLGLGLRREKSHDSGFSGGGRSWSRASSHQVPVDSSHLAGTLDSTTALHAPEKPTTDPSNVSDTLRSPLRGTHALHTGATDTTNVPVPPTILNEEREKFMKQAAERARRRKQEEETAREEARERARKKAAELEALSKASLVSTSPLRQASGSKSPGSKSPLAKSPSATPSALPSVHATSEIHPKKNESLAPESALAAASSWRKPSGEGQKPPLRLRMTSQRNRKYRPHRLQRL
ncbi:hypothetical protein OPQ81_007089 [Rhizoctonia solani]|nr:hypothetical protein OPQ81_007089 [Rhizoctonia solani]